MADTDVAVNFSASIGDLISSVGQVRDALTSLSAPSQQLSAQYDALKGSMNRAFDPAGVQGYGAALSSLTAVNADSIAVASAAAGERIALAQDEYRQTAAAYADAARSYQMSEQQRVAFAREALDQNFQQQAAAVAQGQSLQSLSLSQTQQVLDQRLSMGRQFNDQFNAMTQQSLQQQYNEYVSMGSTITSAFNSQLRGLLSGSENWRTAFKRMLEQMLIDFIEWTEKIIVRNIAAEAAKTAATSAGVTARTGAEQAGAAASLTTQGATMVRSILSSAAESFAGVFGFLSPLLGPAAAGPAAGAYGTVAAMAGSVASADIGMWQVPADMLTMVHHNELIMPAAEAGALRSMLSGSAQGEAASGSSPVSITPTTHFHVNAIDGASVGNWMRSNSREVMRAVDEAVRHGAALGARRLGSR